jgi:hypothetical protein
MAYFSESIYWKWKRKREKNEKISQNCQRLLLLERESGML